MGHNIKRIIKEEYVNYMLNERLDDIEKLHEAKWNFSEPAVRRAAALLAKAMTKVDGVKIKVHDFEWDEGRGAGFELSWDGDKGDGGSYGISDKGEVINHAYPGNPVYGHIKSSERDFEKGIRKYSKRRNESINEGKEYYVIQSLKTGKPKYVKDVGWKVRDNPMWVSDRNISKAYKYKTLKDARKYLESYPPQQTEFWHIYKMPSGNADLGPDLKESINEGKSFYQDVVDLNKSFRLLKIQSPDSYKEIDKKFKVRDIQKLLSNIKTFMDTVPAMREGKVNEAQLQDLPIRSLLGLGVKATVNMGEKKLYDLSEAFEGWLIDNDDNTYEGITAHLDMAIELIQEREPKEAKPHLKKFNKECAKALKEMRRFDEAKFNKKSLMKAMKKADGMITVDRGRQYVIYNPKKGDDSNIESNSGRGGQDFWDMWQDKVIFGVDEDGEEHEINYSDIESYNESVSEGLWDNVRKKKARGESPAKPGDDEYPDSKSWKDAQESVEEDFNIGKQNTSERDRFMKFMFNNGEATGKYKGKEVTVSTNGAKKDPRKWTVEFTKTGKSIKFIDTIASLVVKEGKLTEIRKGDYVGSGKEVGLVNKVSGSGANQVAYVKFNSRPKSFHPILARNLTKTGKKHKGKDLYQEGKINEASRGKIHKAAKKGSYPVTIVVINSGMVVKQELVDTPAAVPAAFNELQKQYPNAIISIESNTGETLFSESVNEGKEQTVAKGKWEIVKVPKGSNNSTRFGDRYYLLLGGQHVGGSVTANGSFSPPSSGNSSEDYVMKILKKAKIVESVNEAQLQDLPIKSLLGLGKFATVSMGEKKLYKLSEAFEEWLIDNDDNTYEGITAHLDMAIELIQERENKEAVPHMNKFNKACGKALSRLK